MRKINWNNPEERRAYHRQKSAEYRKRHPQVALSLSDEDFKWLNTSASMYQAQSLNKHIKSLAVEAAKLGLGEQVEKKPEISQEQFDQLIFILRQTGNNINQIAHHLNIQAKEEGRQIVAGYDESVRTIDACFHMLRLLEEEVKSLTSDMKHS